MKIARARRTLPAAEPVIERLDVPEWGGAVYVRAISANEMAQLRRLLGHSVARFVAIPGSVADFKLRMIGMALCDEHGRRLFRDEEISQLAECNAAAAARVWETARRLAMASRVHPRFTLGRRRHS